MDYTFTIKTKKRTSAFIVGKTDYEYEEGLTNSLKATKLINKLWANDLSIRKPGHWKQTSKNHFEWDFWNGY